MQTILMPKKPADSFEKDLQALENLVDKLEQGDLPLEDALQQFEQGIKLARRCQQTLQTAEQKVSILLKKHTDATLEDFAQDNENT